MALDRPATNYKAGAGITITAADNPTLDAVDVTIAATSTTTDAVWMPLTTTIGGDDVLVFDADHSLIPTLVPL